jgi:hypothetical protein
MQRKNPPLWKRVFENYRCVRIKSPVIRFPFEGALSARTLACGFKGGSHVQKNPFIALNYKYNASKSSMSRAPTPGFLKLRFI